jgi:hypothetical protein
MGYQQPIQCNEIVLFVFYNFFFLFVWSNFAVNVHRKSEQPWLLITFNVVAILSETIVAEQPALERFETFNSPLKVSTSEKFQNKFNCKINYMYVCLNIKPRLSNAAIIGSING